MPSKRSSLKRLKKKDPLDLLAANIFCAHPDVKDLRREQQCALHEFFHTVLAAGFKLYQVVPPDKAKAIIKDKFGLMVEI